VGWGHCGYNKQIKKWMGYSYKGICAEPGCGTPIDHGLSYVCGGMHEGGEHGCGNYFCFTHLDYADLTDIGEEGSVYLCSECYEKFEAGE
jgi:hypothetical protein